MYAIVEIAGQQFKVQKDQKVFVHRLEAEAGSKVEFDQVLLVDDNGKINVGAPAIEGATVTAEVLNHLKGDKVIVFKKKRRKGYKKKNGHRQRYSVLTIGKLGPKKKAPAKAKTTKKKDPPKVKSSSTSKVKKTTTKKSIKPKKAAPKAKAETASKAKKTTTKKES